MSYREPNYDFVAPDSMTVSQCLSLAAIMATDKLETGDVEILLPNGEKAPGSMTLGELRRLFNGKPSHSIHDIKGLKP